MATAARVRLGEIRSVGARGAARRPLGKLAALEAVVKGKVVTDRTVRGLQGASFAKIGHAWLGIGIGAAARGVFG